MALSEVTGFSIASQGKVEFLEGESFDTAGLNVLIAGQSGTTTK